jgi:hypothetical protein
MPSMPLSLRPLLLPGLALALAGCGQPLPEIHGWHGEGPQPIAPERSIVVLPAAYAEDRLAVRREV